MTYVIIFIVLAAALSPLFKAMPSKRQKLLAGLREAAALNGLYVEFRTLPRSEERGVFYGLRRGLQHRFEAAPCYWTQAGDARRWAQEEGEALDTGNTLWELPAGVLGVRVDPSGCGVYWDESGVTEDVVAIAAVLQDLLKI